MPREFGSNDSAKEKGSHSERNRLIHAETSGNDTFSSIAASEKEPTATTSSLSWTKEKSTKDSPSSEKPVTRQTKASSESLEAMRRKRFREDAANGHLSEFFNDIITETREKDPEASVFTLYHEVAKSLPDKIDQTFQKKTLEEMSSEDPKIKKAAEQNFLFMNARGILSIMKPTFTENQANNEDSVHSAIETVYKNREKINPEKNVQLQLRSFLESSEVNDSIAATEDIPTTWLHTRKAGKIITAVDKVIEKNGLTPLPEFELDTVAENLSKALACDKEETFTFIEKRQASAVEQEDIAGTDTTTEKVMEHAFLDEIGKILEEMPEERRKIIQLRYGNQMNSPEIQEELGMTADQVRIKEARAQEKLRHDFYSGHRKIFDPNVRKYEI